MSIIDLYNSATTTSYIGITFITF
ncbi:hypothetical protein WOSG25_410030, partial [Weissella oryzae SG25]